jgi:hypothetical protein
LFVAGCEAGKLLSRSEWQERERLIAAFDRLIQRWPDVPELRDMAERASKEFQQGRVQIAWAFPQKFQLPEFRLSEQSEEEHWEESVQKLRKFWEAQLRIYRLFKNLDEPVADEPRKRRGPGKKGRNTSIDVRHEWAALRWLGISSKRIAGLYRTTATVSAIEKATSEILRRARVVPLDLTKPD